MKLYLVRHGIAGVASAGNVKNDYQRPLTLEGREQTEAVARGLACLDIHPEIVLHSPLVRARQTAEIIGAVLKPASGLLSLDALAPGGQLSYLYKVLKDYQAAEEVFLVGHEPDMGRLAAALLWAGPELTIPFQKAAVCRIDITSIPPVEPGLLAWFITPEIACNLSMV